MTTYAPAGTAPGHWISAAELAHESGLREELVVRFMPSNNSGPAPMYNTAIVPLAKYVKQLADLNAPASAVDAAVRELHNNPSAATQLTLAAPARGTPRHRALTIAGAAAAAALILGGIVGGLIGAGTHNDQAPSPAHAAPVTVTATAPPISAAVPTRPDPVCAEWNPIATEYATKQEAWGKTDPNVPASQWSPEERALNIDIVPVLRAQAIDMRHLAAKATDPVLRTVMLEQASYEDAYADRLPDYQPADKALWEATVRFSSAVNSMCTAVLR